MTSTQYLLDVPTMLRLTYMEGLKVLLVGSGAFFIFYLIITEIGRAKARLPGISGPRGWPVTGNYLQLGEDPPEKLRQWGKTYGDVYQIMMGNMPVIVFTSMQAAKDVFVGQGGSLVDRPRFYTFHGVLSSVASTIGTTVWQVSGLQLAVVGF